LKSRKTEPFVDGISAFALSANGEKALYRQGPAPSGTWFLVATAEAPKGGSASGQLKVDGMETYVEPRVEWDQMYREVWRIERDFFYAPNFHGLDLQSAESAFAPYLSRITGRSDLNYLF